MINKFKNNTRIKVIALLGAIVLWMYVMLVEDPQESRLIENVPVNITNTTDLEDKGFVVYPSDEITADVIVKGNLSKVKSTNKDKIYVYGEIKKPLEGKNDMYINANVSEEVNSSIKNPVVIVNLERVITRDKAIKVSIEGAKQDDISEIKLGKNQISVSGPRSMVNKVKNIEAELNVESGKDNFTRNLKLVPVDEYGKIVEDVELSTYYVKADVEMFKQKTIPIKFNFREDTTEDIKSYDISNKEVVIKGKKDTIDNVTLIETDLIDLTDLEGLNEINVDLIIPNGVNADISKVTISKKAKELAYNSFKFGIDEVELRNNEEVEGEVKKIINTAEINVDVEYDKSLGEVKKSDIKLYIDLTQVDAIDNKYVVKYESNFNFKNVKINSNTVEVG